MIGGQVDTGFIDRHKADLLRVPAGLEEDAILVAAAHVLLQRCNPEDSNSPWGVLDGWRLGGGAQVETLRFIIGGNPRDAEVRHGAGMWRISQDGRVMDVSARPLAGGSLEAIVNGRRVTGSVVRKGTSLNVMVKGRNFAVDLHDPLAAADTGPSGANELRAPMPGKVTQVLVKAGDRVRKGQPVAVLEAMKMEHTLSAPGDFTVKSAPFNAGDQVQEGAVIVSFDTSA
jgi:3-methylcrotonyl-CoA carboxylase alpha subunit